MPSACYLPSHPPGKRQGRQAHCAAMPRSWAAGCAARRAGAGRLSGGCPEAAGGPGPGAHAPRGTVRLLGSRRIHAGLGVQEAPAETGSAAAGGVGSPPVPGPRGPWGRRGRTQDAVTGRPGACGGGGDRPSILAIDPGRPEGGPVIWPARQEQMCPKGHGAHRSCDGDMPPWQEGRRPRQRGRTAMSSRAGRPPLGAAATCRGRGDKSGPAWVRGCPGKHGSSGGRGGTRLPVGLKRTVATERP